MEKTLKELLSLWMIGEDIKKYMFFSMNIFWWSRIAKIMQFIAAFTVIADILGAAVGTGLYIGQKLLKIFHSAVLRSMTRVSVKNFSD